MTTKIEWCDYSLNPGIFGCSPKSTECKNCYAAKMAHRQVAMGNYPFGITKNTPDGVKWTGVVKVAEGAHVKKQFLTRLPSKKRVLVFVTSMADLFHEKVPFPFIKTVYRYMIRQSNCTFMVLTKRPERLLRFQMVARRAGWPYLAPNIYHGMTAGTQHTFDQRWMAMRWVQSAKYFISAEPLLSRIEFPREALDLSDRLQVIWGGERGRQARVMRPEWARFVRDQLDGTGVRRFFKQWGTYLPKSQMIPGVHESEIFNVQPGIGDADPDARFIKVTSHGQSDILDGQTYHERLDMSYG